MKRKKFRMKAKVGLTFLMFAFILAPVSPSISSAAEGAVAQGSTATLTAAQGGDGAAPAAKGDPGEEGTKGLSTKAIVGIGAALAAMIGAGAAALGGGGDGGGGGGGGGGGPVHGGPSHGGGL